MIKKTEFAYEKRYKPGYAVIIMYQWNRYYIASVCERNGKTLAYTLKEYKTLSGAEKYLLEKVDGGSENAGVEPVISYGTEKFIKEGKYWRAEV